MDAAGVDGMCLCIDPYHVRSTPVTAERCNWCNHWVDVSKWIVWACGAHHLISGGARGVHWKFFEEK